MTRFSTRPNPNETPARPVFSSTLATKLTMAGVAVGLGNVWRFPYMMGQYGGSAFLLLYLFFVLGFAIPAAMGEWALGRATRRGPLGAFTQALGKGPGHAVGLLLVITIFVADGYYLVVIAYIAYSACFSTATGFSEASMATYQAGLDHSWLQYAIALTLLLASLWVLRRGLRAGIERVSLWFLPFFGVMVLILIGFCLSLDGAVGHLLIFLKPDPARLADANTIFAALGQAFFSLSLGGTFFVIYGSYLRDSERIPVSAFWTGMGDMSAALLSALFIVPATLAFGLPLDQGPGLIFETLPNLFATMPGGRILGTGFLIGLTLVAFLSNLAALQVLFGALTDHWRMPARLALALIGVSEAVLILVIALEPGLIGKLDLVFGSGMQCLGSALALLALTFGLGRVRALRELFGERRPVWGKALYWWLALAVPLLLTTVLAFYIWEKVQ